MGFTSCLERALAFSKISGYDRKTLPRSSPFHLDYSSFVSDVAVWFFCLYNNLAREQWNTDTYYSFNTRVFQVLYSTTSTACRHQFLNIKQKYKWANSSQNADICWGTPAGQHRQESGPRRDRTTLGAAGLGQTGWIKTTRIWSCVLAFPHI